MKYSLYSSVKSTSCHQVSVAELLERISTKDLKERCAKIAAHILAGEEKEANELKNGLPCIVVSELYKEGAPRKKGTGEPTGLFMMDWDDCKSMEELTELQNKVKTLAISHPVLKDLIVAAHTSPRMHGVHVFCRWIEGCKSVEECQAKFAEMADLPNYDKGCKDPSRCSYLVHKDMFFVCNWGAMERNEAYAEKQRTLSGSPLKGERTKSTAVVKGNNQCSMVNGQCSMVKDPKLEAVFSELTRLCCPKDFIDAEGNVSEGARDNTLLHVLNLFRYVAGNKPHLMKPYLPDWALALDDDNPGTTDSMTERVCERNMSINLPKTLRTALNNLKEKGDELKMTKEERNSMYQKEMEQIELAQRFFFEVPNHLPPVFAEYVKAFPFAWKPAVILSLLPVLGTLMSKVRAMYLDKHLHSLSFQTVIEAEYASGKGNITDMARFCMLPLTNADAIGNEKMNAYNAQVERANQSEKLPEKPDVCVRKIAGDFTVAGFEETLNTSKGLHMWCSTSEIDEVRKIWAAVSFILRKAYDNDFYGRSLQSTKTFRGERRVYFNTLLCGTPGRVKAVYNDSENGLVSRTMFFRLLLDDGKIPVVKMPEKTKAGLAVFLKKLHDKFSLGEDGRPVEEKTYVLDYLTKAMERWLDDKFKDSVLTGNVAIDAYRRRDAVNGFRAGVMAHILFEEKYGGKLKMEHKQTVTAFALWVAEYCLRSHLAKFGNEIRGGDTSGYSQSTSKESLLNQLPDVFMLADVYDKISGHSKATVRSMLARLVGAGYLKREENGFYVKIKKGK